jgi:hypothetical protein
VAIVEEYDAIAKRLRELRTDSAKSADEIKNLEKWRDLAREAARVYVENRRRRAAGKPILPLPTDEPPPPPTSSDSSSEGQYQRQPIPTDRSMGLSDHTNITKSLSVHVTKDRRTISSSRSRSHEHI